jgi:hypothetical protein
MSDVTQVELLLLMSEDARAQGADMMDRHHRECVAQAERIAHLRNLLNQAHRTLLDAEARFAGYLPTSSQPQQPRAVPKEPPVRIAKAAAE